MNGWKHHVTKYVCVWSSIRHHYIAGTFYIRLKGPKSPVYMLERDGYDRPSLSIVGWRLFIQRLKKGKIMTLRPLLWGWLEKHFIGVLIGPIHIRIKGPKARKFFSERNGYDNPKLSLRGWRLFINGRKS